MNEVTREVDELLHGKVVFANRLIAVPVVSKRHTTEGDEQFLGSADAVATLVVRHFDRLATASQLSSVASGGQPEAGVADTASARSVVPLLGNKPAKSSKTKPSKFRMRYYRPGKAKTSKAKSKAKSSKAAKSTQLPTQPPTRPMPPPTHPQTRPLTRLLSRQPTSPSTRLPPSSLPSARLTVSVALTVSTQPQGKQKLLLFDGETYVSKREPMDPCPWLITANLIS